MKYRTTKKAVINGYCKVFSIGYCSAQYLLSGMSPTAYTTRREGWGSDIYDFGSIAISTGYAPFGKNIDYDVLKEWESKAEKANHDERKTILADFVKYLHSL